jgi:acetyl esterase/lipase
MKLHRPILALMAASITLIAAAADSPPSSTQPLKVWPSTPPGEKGGLPPEADITSPQDGQVAGKRVIRLGNVSEPTMTVYKPSKDKDTGAAIVVCPGGAYHILAMDLEGTEICEWLNTIGVTGILLKYRVPARPNQERYQAPLQDAQRAISLTRSHAAEWGINPARIGILGFSAGGHLSAVTSTRFNDRAYTPVDEIDKVSCRPDFTVLIYPAYLTPDKAGDTVSPELTVTSNTPPVFLAMTENDPVRSENGLTYYLALKKAGVPAEMHLYPDGGHGYGLRNPGPPVTTWPTRVEEWMRNRGLLKR